MASIIDILIGGNKNPKAHDEIDSLLEQNNTQMGMSQENTIKNALNDLKGFAKSKEGIGALGVSAAFSELPILAALLGGGAVGTGLNEKFDLSGKLAKMFSPDPNMPQKEELDKELIKKIREKGYPADPEMLERSEEYLNR